MQYFETSPILMRYAFLVSCERISSEEKISTKDRSNTFFKDIHTA